jgi:homoserine kinase type II
MNMSWSNNDEALQETLASVVRFFDLGSLLSTSRAGGYANKNYCVGTEKGEYVMKLLLPHHLDRLRQELLYVQYLTEHAFPAVAYLHAPNGSCIYQNAETLAVAMKKLPGHPPHPTQEVNTVVGSTLATLHTLPTPRLPVKKSWLEKAYLPEALEMIKSHLPLGEIQPILQEYERVRHFDPTQFPQTMVHGDLVPHNCLFEGPELSAVLDWEEVCIGAAVEDFAVCVLNFCFSPKGFDQDLYLALYESYTRLRHLSKEERNAIELAVKYMGVTGSVSFLVQFGVSYPDEHLKASHTFYWHLGLDQWTLC